MVAHDVRDVGAQFESGIFDAHGVGAWNKANRGIKSLLPIMME